MQWFHNDDTHPQIAEVCLRCFISNQIKEFCLELEQKFGKNHDFTSAELLPLVLESTFRSPYTDGLPVLHIPKAVINGITHGFHLERVL
jgi:hypothetical protein